MATMNVVYPHFHDTQSSRATSTSTNTKDIDIDNSVYHLLSLYLNADALELATAAAPQHKKHNGTPYWRQTTNKNVIHKRNWLGEAGQHPVERKSKQDLLLERNTIKNSIAIPHYETVVTKTKKSRSKSVSFNETVTIILPGQLAEQRVLLEDDIFVDALESFVEE
jgi:hypothetical protein